MMQSRTTDWFDLLLRPNTTLPPRLGGLKRTPESVAGDVSDLMASRDDPAARCGSHKWRRPLACLPAQPPTASWVPRTDPIVNEETAHEEIAQCPGPVASYGCPFYVVAVLGVGPIVAFNSLFFDVVIGFDDYSGISGARYGRGNLSSTASHAFRTYYRWLRFIKRRWRSLSASSVTLKL